MRKTIRNIEEAVRNAVDDATSGKARAEIASRIRKMADNVEIGEDVLTRAAGTAGETIGDAAKRAKEALSPAPGAPRRGPDLGIMEDAPATDPRVEALRREADRIEQEGRRDEDGAIDPAEIVRNRPVLSVVSAAVAGIAIGAAIFSGRKS